MCDYQWLGTEVSWIQKVKSLLETWGAEYLSDREDCNDEDELWYQFKCTEKSNEGDSRADQSEREGNKDLGGQLQLIVKAHSSLSIV